MHSFKKGSGEIMPLGVPQKQRENALTGVEQATHATFENVFLQISSRHYQIIGKCQRISK